MVNLTCAKEEQHTYEGRQFVGTIYDRQSITEGSYTCDLDSVM